MIGNGENNQLPTIQYAMTSYINIIAIIVARINKRQKHQFAVSFPSTGNPVLFVDNKQEMSFEKKEDVLVFMQGLEKGICISKY